MKKLVVPYNIKQDILYFPHPVYPFNMCSVHKYNANTNTNKQQQQHHCLCLQSFLLLHWDRNHTSGSSGLITPWQHVRLSILQLHEIVSRRSRVVSSKMVTVSGKNWNRHRFAVSLCPALQNLEKQTRPNFDILKFKVNYVNIVMHLKLHRFIFPKFTRKM